MKLVTVKDFFFSCKVEGKLTVLPGDIQEVSMVWTDPNIT